MKTIFRESEAGLNRQEALDMVRQAIEQAPRPLRRVLLIPPDITRLNSMAGLLTELFFQELEPQTRCDVLPALGTHMPMTREECSGFYGACIPEDRYLVHDWRKGTVVLGVVDAKTCARISRGLMEREIPVELSRYVAEGGYDWIVSIGQVVPHEVVGMANHAKNLFVGCGGSDFINASHLLSVLYGFEKGMGRDHTPVRDLFDYAAERFLGGLPLLYALTVTTTDEAGTHLNGLYLGQGREGFNRAVRLSQRLNVTYVERPMQTCVVRLEEKEFRTSWVGNKAVYRTRKALANGGRLIVLAPGFERFGEDMENDALIRKFGFCGGERVLRLMEEREELRKNLSVVAHLVQGSGDGRFTVCYCTKPQHEQEIRGVGFDWMDIDRARQLYGALQPGWNRTAEGEIYYIDNPALGLWDLRPEGEA